MDIIDPKRLRQWYQSRQVNYQLLMNVVQNTLKSLLENAEVDYLSVTARVKDVESFIEKVGRKNYQDPASEMTDAVGVRVITFIESDAIKVNSLIKEAFNIDEAKSLNKSGTLGVDQVGYRSFHFVGDLGERRCNLPEYKHLKGLVFEIQVRTILQHAWAEIQHDRNYKFNGKLPGHIARRLNILAGNLELADREFNNLADEVDRYTAEVNRQAGRGDLAIELNTISLHEYLLTLKSRFDFEIELLSAPGALAQVVGQLYTSGIQTISEVDDLFAEDFMSAIRNFKNKKYLSLPYLITEAMMYSDIDDYFLRSHVRNNFAVDEEMFGCLVQKYGSQKVECLLKDNGVSVIDWDTREFVFGALEGRRLKLSKPNS